MTYNFCVSDFEGPLDLLLHMVKESKMDIYEINISDIINQYLDFIHSLEEKNIDIASEYLVMASELMEIKSRMLLPRYQEESEEEELDPREQLIHKLIEYQKYKKLSQQMEQKESEAEWTFERKKSQRILPACRCHPG